MKTIRIFILFLILIAGTQVSAADTVPPEKRAEIEKLLELTGALKLGQQLSAAMVTNFSNSLKASHPNIPQKALDVLPEEVNAVLNENLDSFKELIILIYDRHYSLQDVQGLNQFYASELGRKVIQTMPLMMQESISAGQKWGQMLGPEVARRVEARFKKDGVTL